MDLLTVKQNNQVYAPGIATYGIDGSDGEKGKPGSCVYYTDYNIDGSGSIVTSGADYKTFIGCIKKNMMLQKARKNVELPHKYADGDYIITSNGYVYEMTGVDGMITMDESMIAANDVFRLVGHINPNDSDDDTFFRRLSGTSRLYMASEYDGLDITSSSVRPNVNKGYSLRVIGDYATADENLRTNLVSLISTYGGGDDSTLSFYYDNVNNAFVIDSNKPLCIDAKSIQFKDGKGSSQQVDEYSPILTKESTLTSYINGMRKLRCQVRKKVTDLCTMVYDYVSVPNRYNPYEGIDGASAAKAGVLSGGALDASLAAAIAATKVSGLYNEGRDVAIPLLEWSGERPSAARLSAGQYLGSAEGGIGGEKTRKFKYGEKVEYFIRFVDEAGEEASVPDGCAVIIYYEDGSMSYCAKPSGEESYDSLLKRPFKVGVIDMVEFVMIPEYFDWAAEGDA